MMEHLRPREEKTLAQSHTALSTFPHEILHLSPGPASKNKLPFKGAQILRVPYGNEGRGVGTRTRLRGR